MTRAVTAWTGWGQGRIGLSPAKYVPGRTAEVRIQEVWI